MTRQIKKIIAAVMALLIVFGTLSSGAAALEAKPLFTVSDINSRQGEEVTIYVSLAQAINKTSNRINALDLSLRYDTGVFEILSISKGPGLTAALKALEEGNLGVDTGGYIYSESTNTPGEIRWSLSSIDGFTFSKGSAFAIIRVKIKNASNLENNPVFTAVVTNAARLNDDKKTYTDRTNEFAPYSNNATIAVNLTTLCDWEYDSETDSYTLVKFHDTKATYFTIPDTYNDGTHGEKPIRKIKGVAFRDNTALKKVALGENIKSIESAAFTGCEKLEVVEVYTTDAFIGENAFFGSSNNFLVRCIKGSTIDAYAQRYKYRIEYFGDIKKCTIEGVDAEKYYTGAPVTLNHIKITALDGTELTEGVDYVIEYTDNTELGTAHLTIKGTGSYFGSVEYTFNIICPYHVEGSEYYTVVATYDDCEAGGKSVESCSFCGYIKETDLPAKQHNVKGWEVVTDPTCAKEGLEALLCTDCNKHLDEKAIEKKPHDYKWEVTKEATCLEAGTESCVCQVCGNISETKEIEILPHNKEWIVTKEADCEENGEKVLKCTLCDTVYETEVIPGGGGHKPASEWEVTKEATCQEEGEKVLKCTVCQKILDREIIAKKEHDLPGSWTNIKTPTCTEDGLQARICRTCGEPIETRVKGALGHDPESTWTIQSEATCTKDGVKVKFCERCHEVVAEKPITAPGHAAAEFTTIKAADCTHDGEKAKLCPVCKEYYDNTTIAKTGHAAAEFTTIKEPDCTHDGEKAKLCPVCKEYYDNTPIAKKGHTAGDWETVVEPTCTKEGFKQQLCTVCHELVRTKTIPAKGHTPVDEYITAPTYKFEGKKRSVCSVCGQVLTNAVIVPRVYPDLDGDKKFTAADALMILQHSTQYKLLSAEQQLSADCDGDRRINSYDALIVLRLSTGELKY